MPSKRLGAAALTLAVLLLTGAAIAYLSNHAHGRGEVLGGTLTAVTITAQTATTPLYPGANGDLALTVSNPNPLRAHIGSLELNTAHSHNTAQAGFSVDSGHTDCQNPDLTFVPQNNGSAGWDIPADGAAGNPRDLDLAGAISMGADADGACQGATFTVYLKTGE